jgi:hypothetical protein
VIALTDKKGEIGWYMLTCTNVQVSEKWGISNGANFNYDQNMNVFS